MLLVLPAEARGCSGRYAAGAFAVAVADAAAVGGGIRVGGLKIPACFLFLGRLLLLLVPPEALLLALTDPREAEPEPEAEPEAEVAPLDDGLQIASACLIDAAAAVGLR